MKYGSMEQKNCLLFVLIVATLLVNAHEFWLQPEKIICNRGQTNDKI